MKITAQDLIKLKIVDRIVEEPAGGAHSEPRGRHRRPSATRSRTS
jgi:acetyl-CoA carboxylase alpha subunit